MSLPTRAVMNELATVRSELATSIAKIEKLQQMVRDACPHEVTIRSYEPGEHSSTETCVECGY